MLPYDLIGADQGWLIEPARMDRMIELSKQFDLGDERLGFESRLGDDRGDDRSIVRIEGSTAIMSVRGPLMREPSWIARLIFGACDLEEIRSQALALRDNDNVERVLLDIDSPGGTVNGTPEAADAIGELARKKPVFAFTAGVMASAAYWLASQATSIRATPTAAVGSIGVLWIYYDRSKMAEDMGLKVEVFKTGIYKGMGTPGTSLSKEQSELVQTRINSIFSDFKSAVNSGPRSIPDSAMQGQVFYGSEAAEVNLCEVVSSRDEAFDDLSNHNSTTQPNAHMSDENKSGDSADNDKLDALTKRVEAAEAQVKDLKEAAEKRDSEVETLKSDLQKSKDDAKAAQDLADEAEKERDKAKHRADEAEKAQKDFDDKVAAKAAEVAAGNGSAPVSGNAESEDEDQDSDEALANADLATLWEKCDAIEDAAAQTAFYKKHIKPRIG